MADGKRFRFEGDSYYLKSPAEMRALFADLPEACDNTLAIAERCGGVVHRGQWHLHATIPLPGGGDEDSWFRHEVQAGLYRRYPVGIPDEVRKQAHFEHQRDHLDGLRRLLPRRCGLHQLGEGAWHSRWPGPRLRCGLHCRVCDAYHRSYPLVHGLIFERFLNPDRVDMLDFDIDFDERRRGEVIRYVSEEVLAMTGSVR